MSVARPVEIVSLQGYIGSYIEPDQQYNLMPIRCPG